MTKCSLLPQISPFKSWGKLLRALFNYELFSCGSRSGGRRGHIASNGCPHLLLLPAHQNGGERTTETKRSFLRRALRELLVTEKPALPVTGSRACRRAKMAILLHFILWCWRAGGRGARTRRGTSTGFTRLPALQEAQLSSYEGFGSPPAGSAAEARTLLCLAARLPLRFTLGFPFVFFFFPFFFLFARCFFVGFGFILFSQFVWWFLGHPRWQLPVSI